MNLRVANFTIALLLIAGMLVAAFSVQPASAQSETWMISGIVRDELGNPIPEVLVAALGPGGIEVASAISDSAGIYAMIVPADIYDLAVTPPPESGLASTTIYGVDISSDVIVDIVLVPATFVTFSGQVVDRIGRPVPYQQFSLSSAVAFEWLSSDHEGYFSVEVPSGHNYGINFENYQSDDITREQIPSYYRLGMWGLDLSQDTEMTITLENLFLTGMVIDTSGNPVPDVDIDIPWSVTSFGGFDGDYSSSTTSDAEGKFNLTVFPSTVDYLTATPPEGSPWSGVSIHALEVMIDTSITIQLTQSVTFSGHVVDRIGRPVPYQQFSLSSAVAFEWLSSDHEGYFSVEVPSGHNYGINFENYQSDDITREQIPSYYRLGMWGLDLSQDTEMTITLENLFLTGMVIDTSGNPVPDVDIDIPWSVTSFGGFDGDYSSSTISDAEGKFNFTVFPSLVDYLTATPPEGSPYGPVAVDKFAMFEDKILIIILTSLVEPIKAAIDFDPDTLNLLSEGRWVTVYIEFPPGANHDINDIDLSTISLNGIIFAETSMFQIGDYDSDGTPDLMVKFDRLLVNELLEVGDSVTIIINGLLVDSTPFEGTDTIRVISNPLWKTIGTVLCTHCSMAYLAVREVF